MPLADHKYQIKAVASEDVPRSDPRLRPTQEQYIEHTRNAEAAVTANYPTGEHIWGGFDSAFDAAGVVVSGGKFEFR